MSVSLTFNGNGTFMYVDYTILCMSEGNFSVAHDETLDQYKIQYSMFHFDCGSNGSDRTNINGIVHYVDSVDEDTLELSSYTDGTLTTETFHFDKAECAP